MDMFALIDLLFALVGIAGVYSCWRVKSGGSLEIWRMILPKGAKLPADGEERAALAAKLVPAVFALSVTVFLEGIASFLRDFRVIPLPALLDFALMGLFAAALFFYVRTIRSVF